MKRVKKFNRIWVLGMAFILLICSCERNGEQIAPSDITGVYSCQESSAHSGVRKYLVEIDQVKNSEDLYIISNFHNKGENEFIFTELDQDTLRIINQAISEMSFNGKGTVGADFRSISLYYETDDGLTLLDYFANYTR